MTLEVISIPGSGTRLTEPLGQFFESLTASGAGRHFHPHALTCEMAASLVSYSGRDQYYALVNGDCVLGYGILRGWDEGYDVPSLGIAIDASARGAGLGEVLMRFLHSAARVRGATRIRLTVDQTNEPALHLYEKLAYTFEKLDGDRLVGYRDL